MDTDRDNGQAAEDAFLNCANESTFLPRFAPVRWLVLNKGATRVRRSRERSKPDELWHGDAYDPKRPEEPAIPVYLRLGGASSFNAELVCGCMARALGLPAPEVFVVNVKPGMLRRSTLANKDTYTLCVATLDLGGNTFTQLLNDDDDAAVQLLHDWADLSKVAAFDEWTANPDRNMGNLIYAAQTLHIIDHADAFGGACRGMLSMAELTEQMFANRLADLLNVFDAAKRNTMLKEIGEWLAASAEPLDVKILVEQAGTWPLDHRSRDQDLVDFLSQRLTVTHKLLCNRLGHPQLSLTATHP